jgi:steroid delta-isomerase-like uncharacterized protein
MGVEENKAVVRRYQEAYNRNDMEALKGLVAQDLISHNLIPGLGSGLAGGVAAHRAVLRSFPDVQTTIEQLVAEGDTVVMRFTTRGTHRGRFGRLEPTGKTFSIDGVSIFRLADGKIVEHWGLMDQASLMQQLGAG